MEEWRDIPGYEGYYQISNMGKLKSLSRMVYQSKGFNRKIKERIKKLSLGHDGYFIATLNYDNKMKNVRIHRLVANAFLGKSDKPQINHKNFNKLDNRVENLEWVTAKENTGHAVLGGRFLCQKGSKNNGASINEKDVIEIRRMYDKSPSHETKIKIQCMYSISKTSVYMIVNRKSWLHVR